MKKWFAAIAVVVLGTVGVIAWHAIGRRASPAAPTASPGPSATLGVDQFMRNVDRYPGPVTVEGVVSAVAGDKQMLALIDRKEAAECGTVTCAILTLPVRWGGELPRIGQQVCVTGAVRRLPDGKVFIAQALTAGEQVVSQ